MPSHLVIRNARLSDAQAISDLIISVAHYFSPSTSDKIADWLFESVSPAAIESYIDDPKYNYLVALSGDRIVGVIAVRETKHIHHLFVASDFHRQGVAGQLWARAKNDALLAGNKEGFFVRSSEFAVPVYKTFGFRVAGDRSEKDGIVYVPMRLE